MRALLSWVDKVHEPERGNVSVNDLAYKPDGSELLVAAGTRILVYDGADGAMVQALRGHKDTVYCVTYASDGDRFASGSADKSVIIWTEQHEGVLKYNHNDAIQCLSFCPTANLLISCAISDFGMWALDQKSVNKHKTSARVCCCSWTRDGQYFALGLFNGTIYIRTRNGDEKAKIERPSGAPIWSIAFNPNKSEEIGPEGEMTENALAVADWTPSLSFYNLSGHVINKERTLTFDPCSVDYFTLGEFLVLGGSNKQVSLHTKEGIRLGIVSDMQSWVWSCRTKPNSQYVAIGCEDGTVACYQLTFSTVHGLHKDRYAFRENMTDVVVQHLLTDKRIRIRCRDLVKKVAIYRNKLAVQLSDRVVIYQLTSDDDTEMNYRMAEKIVQNFECSLLVVCGRHVILCQEKRLQCYDFRAMKEREWILDALIRYIKVVGGPTGREALLVGLKNGQVLKIFVDNPFPVELLKIKSAVRCLDLSLAREKLAIVDENSVCLVYDLKTKELLFQEPHANSVSWNTQNEDLLCFSGNSFLSIKAREFPIYQQRMQGFVVGFTGSRVFCLHMYSMSTVEVPLSNQMYQYLEHNMFQEAYLIACLGVTEADWELLALEALEHLDLITSRKAFIRTRNLRFLELINRIEESGRRGTSNQQALLAEINAYQGKLSAAARLFQQCGQEQLAVDMYTDMRMFDQAQELLASANADTQRMLIRKRAEWASSVNEPKAAAEMFASAGDYMKAAAIMARHGWNDMLIKLGRSIDKNQTDILIHIAKSLVAAKEYKLAAELYAKIGDAKALLQVHVIAEQWQDAFTLVEQNPQFKDDVYLPYAHWLAERDRFEDAQKAFHRAGRQNEALHVLEQLTTNAVHESRYSDASYYYWMLSNQYLDKANEMPDQRIEHLEKFKQYQMFADVYFAYDAIHHFTNEPFTSYQPDALLNISRFVLHSLGNETQFPGVSRVSTYYTLAKQGKALGAYKLSRHAFERLQQMRAPPRFQAVIDTGALQIRAKPYQDAEELLPVCYHCSTSNPLLNNLGNVCVHCKAPFVFSFVSFEVLPVVEFCVENGVSDQEAKELIEAEPPLAQEGAKFKDAFKENASSKQGGYTPKIATRSMLINLNRTEVIICEWPSPLKYRYYRNIVPEISITKCDCCNRLFHTDDFELAVLQHGRCPFCRNERLSSKSYADDLDEEHDGSENDFS